MVNEERRAGHVSRTELDGRQLILELGVGSALGNIGLYCFIRLRGESKCAIV